MNQPRIYRKCTQLMPLIREKAAFLYKKILSQ